MSLEVGALIEPLAVGWHAADMSPYKDGDAALVLGGGPIGLAVVQTLKIGGCQNIIASVTSRARRDLAVHFGAHHAVDPANEDVAKKVLALTNGAGADVVFDAVGSHIVLDKAFQALKARGTLVNIAVWDKPVHLAMNEITFREQKYIGV